MSSELPPMIEPDWILVLLTAAVTAVHGAAVAGFWQSWCLRGKPAAAIWLAASGALWGAALIGWRHLAGPEFGVLYWLGGTAIGAWIAVAASAAPARAMSPRHTVCQFRFWSADQWLRGGKRLLVSGPLALSVSLILCLLAAHWLPGDPANRWVAAALLLPLLWATLLTWVLCARRIRSAACCLSVVALLGSLILLRTER